RAVGWVERALAVLPVRLLVSVARSCSYTSAIVLTKLPPNPPATSTLPEGSSVAVCPSRAAPRLPVLLHAPAPPLAAGSYSSALLKVLLILPLSPPATSTLPEGSSVAVCDPRAIPRLPVLL